MNPVISSHTRITGEVVFTLSLIDCTLNQENRVKLYQNVLEECNAKIVNRSLLGLDGIVTDYLIHGSIVELSSTSWGVDLESSDKNLIALIKSLLEERIKLLEYGH